MKYFFPTTIILSSLLGCSEKPIVLDKKEVLNSTVEQVILPDLEVLERTAQDFYENSLSFCANPNSEQLQSLIFSWRGGKTMLKKIELLNFGPYNYIEIDISRRLDNWPERGEGIEEVIAGDAVISANFIKNLDQTTASSGYPALGYLLNSFQEEHDLISSFSDERRCSYLVAQSELNLSIIKEFRSAWLPEGRNYASEIIDAGSGSSTFISEEEALASLMGSMNRLVKHMADIKLAQPLDLGRSDAVEASFSLTSLRDLRNNLDAIENLYKGANPSISDYVVSERGEEIDLSIRTAIDDVRFSLEAVPEPLSVSVLSHPQVVAALIVSLENLSDVFSHDAERFLMYEAQGY